MKFVLTTILFLLPSILDAQVLIRIPHQEKAVQQVAVQENVTKFDIYPDKPIVIGNSIPNCGYCDIAKRWQNLPFEIEWRENSRAHLSYRGSGYPIFEFPNKEGVIVGVWGADKDRLIKTWTLYGNTDNEIYADKISEELGKSVAPVGFSAPKPTVGSEIVCGCRGEHGVCCVCARENASGVRAKPCTCSSTKGSVHLYTGSLANYQPQGATGEYFKFGVDPSDADAQPTPYDEVRRIVGLLNLTKNDTFVDYGCGGDARFCIAATLLSGCNSIGVEIDHGRAESAKALVSALNLSNKISIIEGDATQVDVRATAGVAYLWPDVLGSLKPKIQNLTRFVSYQHQVPGLAMSKSGDAFIWKKPTRVAGAVWNGRVYARPVCNSPNCSMCNSIRRQLAARR